MVDDSVALLLHSSGVLYVPDFMSNAGGVIQNAVEFNQLGPEALDQLLREANARTSDVLDSARSGDVTPLEVARTQALALVAAGTGAAPAAVDA